MAGFRNIDVKVDGDKVSFSVDLSKIAVESAVISRSGQTQTIANSGGIIPIPGKPEFSFNLLVFRGAH
jgi:hypothetical protein